MAREKGMGNLQKEKSGRWTMRVGICGKRYCRSTRTKDKDKAERFLQRFLAQFGLGEKRLPLADVWNSYVMSPDRNDLSPATLNSKRIVWMHFARWMEHYHLAVTDLSGVTHDVITEYLALLRSDLCGSTYNSKVCVLREIFHTLANKAGLEDDPWEGVRLRPDDCHSRRELTMDELKRLLEAARKAGSEWHKLFLVGIYTGLRLGDCCRLDWSHINIGRGIIQLIPRKTRRHAHGRPVTIPIHKTLGQALLGVEVIGTQVPNGTRDKRPFSDPATTVATLPTPESQNGQLASSGSGAPLFASNGNDAKLGETQLRRSGDEISAIPNRRVVAAQVSPNSAYGEAICVQRTGAVLPTICEMYLRSRHLVSQELSRIFKAANIVTSVRIEGRKNKTPEATFHSLRHTFVSFSANAGVPLHIVQSIVGHESTAMTRHYYHENLTALQQAVNAIPSLG